MKTLKFDSREDWLDARRGKITGSRLKDIVVKRGTGMKIGFYELIAERLAAKPNGENPMDRGARLEDEAIDRFEKETGKKADRGLVIWTRDDTENIAVSPDGFIGETEAVEAKCLASSRHIEAYLTKEIPSEYKEQATQYFIVNEKLEKLFFCFYDPRLIAKDFFIIEISREMVKKEIEEYLDYQKNILDQVDKIVLELTF